MMKKLIPIILAAASLNSGSARADAPISLFDGKTLNGWIAAPANAWTVTDGAIAMTGAARGVLYTTGKYTHYRVIYSVRQVKGVDHWPCVLVFGTTGTPLPDALAALQFQLPQVYTWDYRKGHNNAGSAFFKTVGRIPGVTKSAWARCEILVDARNGTARTAAAQPIGTKAIELVDLKDASIPNLPSPFAIQSHNAGQFDEYKDITIEVNPAIDDLITTKDPFVPIVAQAESATISPGVTEAVNAGFTGSGYANTNNVLGAFVEWTVTVPSAGSYSLDFRFANGAASDRPADLRINGALVQAGLSFPSTGAFTTWSDVTVTKMLVAGANVIRLTATTANGCANLDKVTLAR